MSLQQSLLLILIGSATSALGFPYTHGITAASLTGSICPHDDDITHYWENLSPWYAQPATFPDPPSDCHTTFVQVLSRHGSRYPLPPSPDQYKSLLSRIQEAIKDRPVSSLGEYAFLKDYKYSLGEEALTDYGIDELQKSGKTFYRRYEKLVKANSSPQGGMESFVRASDATDHGRVVRSAQNFLKGVAESQGQPAVESTPILFMTEAQNVSDPLWNPMCQAFQVSPNADVANNAMNTWTKIFAPKITARLNEGLKPFVFNDSDTTLLMQICPYVTVAQSPPRKISLAPFCKLFTVEEWKDFEYLQTLNLQYGFGSSNPLGATRGSPWVQEIVARMTGQPITRDNTHYGGINMTLDGNERTFPLDKKIYLDFSHDTDLTSLYAALGLFPEAKDAIKPNRRVCAEEAGGYTGSGIAPFAARMYVEKIVCPQRHKSACQVQGSEERVRITVNERVMKLVGCSVDEYGTCRFDDWLKTPAIKLAMEGGDGRKC